MESHVVACPDGAWEKGINEFGRSQFLAWALRSDVIRQQIERSRD